MICWADFNLLYPSDPPHSYSLTVFLTLSYSIYFDNTDGPTETTIWSSSYTLSNSSTGEHTCNADSLTFVNGVPVIPIGTPISQVRHTYPILLCHVESCPIISYPLLSWPVMSYSVLSYSPLYALLPILSFSYSLTLFSYSTSNSNSTDGFLCGLRRWNPP